MILNNQTKILIGAVAILGIFAVFAAYENCSLRKELRELSAEQEASAEKIEQQRGTINYLLQNSGTVTTGGGVSPMDMPSSSGAIEPAMMGAPSVVTPSYPGMTEPAMDPGTSSGMGTPSYGGTAEIDYASGVDEDSAPDNSYDAQ